MKRLQDENNVLTKELSIEKEKLHTLEAAFERIRKQGICSLYEPYSLWFVVIHKCGCIDAFIPLSLHVFAKLHLKY